MHASPRDAMWNLTRNPNDHRLRMKTTNCCCCCSNSTKKIRTRKTPIRKCPNGVGLTTTSNFSWRTQTFQNLARGRVKGRAVPSYRFSSRPFVFRSRTGVLPWNSIKSCLQNLEHANAGGARWTRNVRSSPFLLLGRGFWPPDFSYGFARFFQPLQAF